MDTASTTSPFMPMFESFRNELDEHHDGRERIVKVSRDITALSKKILRNLQTPISQGISKEIKTRHASIRDLFVSVAPDLQGLNAWRYQWQISGGCQEFMEAVSLQHYLETQSLITREQAQAMVPDGVELTAEDYLLGLFDLTGELMRFAITSMATSGSLPRGAEGGSGRDVLADMRLLRTCFERLDMSSTGANGSPLKRDIEKKMEVMRQSVEKVETAAYGLIIRGRERPKGWVPDLSEEQDRGREAMESY
ncbi:MAG: hypothetical protein Q9214_007600 [Letrouitia sp. 1 TL-2023]